MERYPHSINEDQHTNTENSAEQQLDFYSDIQDLVTVGHGQMTTFHRPDGKFLSKHELDMIREHQDEIRGGTFDESGINNPRDPSLAGHEADYLHEFPLDTTEGKSDEEIAEIADRLHDLGFVGTEHLRDVAKKGDQGPQPQANINPDDLADAIVRAQTKAADQQIRARQNARKAQRKAEFLDTGSPSPESIARMQRAEYLQRRVDKLLGAQEAGTANHLSLRYELDSFSQEFTDIISKFDSSEDTPFKVTEGGMKLLEKGLLAGNVPELEDFVRLNQFVGSQGILRVTRDINGNPSPDFAARPRYTQGGEPGFGPYEHPECDTVAHVVALINPENWILSEDDIDYLTDILNYGDGPGQRKMTRFETASSPSGQVYFWNRPPFNIDIGNEVRNLDPRQSRMGPAEREATRISRMSDPNTSAAIAQTDTILDWWNESVGKISVKSNPPDIRSRETVHQSRDETRIAEIQKYARARLTLHARLTGVI